MIALFYVLILVWGGYGLALFLPLPLTRLERGAVAAVLGMVLGSWVPFLLALVWNQSIALALTAALAAGMGMSWWFPRVRRTGIALPFAKVSVLRAALEPGLLVGCLIMWVTLWHTHLLLPESDGWYSAGYTWSDLALHMSLAAAFAYRSVHSVLAQFTLFPSVPLTYPFLNDFFSGMLVRLGASWQEAFWLPSILLSYAVTILSVGLVERLTASRRAAWVHFFLVLFSGSFWGIVLYLQDVPHEGWTAFANRDYANLGEGPALHFANFLNSHLLPQRSYLFGICVALLVLLLFQELFQARPKGKRAWWLGGVAAFLLGSLPFIHVHSFFVVFGVGCFIASLETVRRGERWHQWWLLLLGAFGLAVPQLAWQMAGSYHQGFGQFYLFWLTPVGTSPLLFWFRNVGLALVLIPCSALVLRHFPRRSLGPVLYSTGVVIAVVCNIYQFQPNLWDNMKFLTYAYWFLLIPTAWWLASMSRRWWGMILAAVLILCLTGSGLLSMAREYTLHYEVLSSQELALGNYLRTALPLNARVLTSNRHNHPVSLLTGRELVMGYPGWLWSYGIDYAQTESDVQSMFAGGSQTESLLEQYGVTDVVVELGAEGSTNFNLTYYQSHYSLIYNQNNWLVFDCSKKL